MASQKRSRQELPSVDALLEEAQQSDRSFRSSEWVLQH